MDPAPAPAMHHPDPDSGPVIDPAVERAIATRRSVRGFLPTAIPRETIARLLQLASRAPSMTNTQPWRVHVITGARLAALTADLAAAHEADQHWEAEYDYYPAEWTAPYVDRRRENGWALYGLLGIVKGDRAASKRQHGRNYGFFGAPVGMMFTAERVLRTGSYIDFGMFMENLMVAARGAGLDTCPQAAFAFMHPIIRTHLVIPDNEIVVCGMALGVADAGEPANALRTVREPVDGFTVWHDAG